MHLLRSVLTGSVSTPSFPMEMRYTLPFSASHDQRGQLATDDRQAWIREETKLWHRLMDPRTYRLTDEDGKPLSENKKVALSWKLYQRFITH